jgi:transcription elongation factor Elf1
MEKSYNCPSCGNLLLKVVTIENDMEIEKYYCDICSTSYLEVDLIVKDKTIDITKNRKKEIKD